MTEILAYIGISVDTAANWTAGTRVPYLGEICYESDTGKWKVGDGINLPSALSYKTIIASEIAALTSAELRTILSDETGTGAAVFATSPTLTSPALGTPTALVGTNITGTALGLKAGSSFALESATTTVEVSASPAPTAGQVLTAVDDQTAIWDDPAGGAGDVATDAIWDALGDLAVGTGANTAARLPVGADGEVLVGDSGEPTGLDWDPTTGTGSIVRATSPTLVTPALGTPTALVLTSATGLPTAGMLDNVVTNAKLADVAANTVKSNVTSSSADPADNGLCVVQRRMSQVMPWKWTDFEGTGATGGNSYDCAPYNQAVIASGTTPAALSGVEDSDHPGQVNIVASTSGNSGARYITEATHVIKGGETFKVIFLYDLLANGTAYFGFHDSVNVTAPTDAMMIRVVGTTLDGICYGGGASTATGTSHTISTGVWYRMEVSVNSAADTVTFALYECNDGPDAAAIWTDTVTGANVPTGAEAFGVGAVVTNNGLAAVSIGHIDLMGHGSTVQLTR